jgi:DNA-binding transcriptional regulator YiaG
MTPAPAALASATARVLGVAKARRYATSGEGKRIRQENNLSLQDIAGPVGVGVNTLWRWERGRNLPRGEAGTRWCQVLDALRESQSRETA